MSGGAGYYDESCTMYSPDGRVYQIEYAAKAVEKSSLCIAVKNSTGYVIGVDKSIINQMLVVNSQKKTHIIDAVNGLCLAGSGLSADLSKLGRSAKEEASDFRQTYHSAALYTSPLPTATTLKTEASLSTDPSINVIPDNRIIIPGFGTVIANRVATLMHSHTIDWFLRPFGCSIIIGSFYEDKGPKLFSIDHSGQLNEYYKVAIGTHKNLAASELEKISQNQCSDEELLNHIACILIKLREDLNVEMKDLENFPNTSDLILHLREQYKMELELYWCNKNHTNGFVKQVTGDLYNSVIRQAITKKIADEVKE